MKKGTCHLLISIWLLLLPALSCSGQVSGAMRAFIKEVEGFSPTVYMDGFYRAVGYGHRIVSTDPDWIQELEMYDEITRELADLLFEWDMNHLVSPGLRAVKKDIGAGYPQNVYDVMGSLIYNMGLEGLRNTNFYRLFRERKYMEAFVSLSTTHIGAPGLPERRKGEIAFLIRHFDFGTNSYRIPPSLP